MDDTFSFEKLCSIFDIAEYSSTYAPKYLSALSEEFALEEWQHRDSRLFECYRESVIRNLQELLENYSLSVVEVSPLSYKFIPRGSPINPTIDIWHEPLVCIVDAINAYGTVTFGSLREFMEQGRHSSYRNAVLHHLPCIAKHHLIYGTVSLNQLVCNDLLSPES